MPERFESAEDATCAALSLKELNLIVGQAVPAIGRTTPGEDPEMFQQRG